MHVCVALTATVIIAAVSSLLAMLAKFAEILVLFHGSELTYSNDTLNYGVSLIGTSSHSLVAHSRGHPPPSAITELRDEFMLLVPPLLILGGRVSTRGRGIVRSLVLE